MADRYWVGGTASWDGTAGTKWATTSGGAGGASVPTTTDDVFFNGSSSGTVTIATGNTGAQSITCTGFTGTLTGTAAITVAGSLTVASGMTYSHTGTVTFTGTGTHTITSAGKALSAVTINSVGGTYTLADALNISTRTLTVTRGTFDTAGYNVTAGFLSSSNANTRTITLGASTVTIGGTAAGSALDFSISTNLTLNAGTSQITLTFSNVTSSGGLFSGGGKTFYNVSFTSTSRNATISNDNTFNNLSLSGRASAGANIFSFSNDQTINGTFTASAGTNATMRSRITGGTIQKTLTCNAIGSFADIDFQSIKFAGACVSGGNVTGTRLGNCGNNSNMTFDAPKTVYWNLAGGGSWAATGWAASSGGTPAINNFPLAQDTAVFEATGLNSGATVTVLSNYSVGTIDMSARTSNTMTLAINSPQCLGDWINGTGTTISGTQTFFFAGFGPQSITSAGKAFTQPINILLGSAGSVTLQDAFACDGFTLTSGTFNAAGYNVTTPSVTSSNSNIRTLALGSGTWTISGTGGWTATATNLTVSGSGTISLTSASAKTFAGGGVATYPNLNQGGLGTLTITGANTFTSISNTAEGQITLPASVTTTVGALNLVGTP